MNAPNVGQEVVVRWGYGLGFRAEGRGRITKVYPKSVRVALLHDVMSNGRVGWPAGFELRSIPRVTGEWDGIRLLEPDAERVKAGVAEIMREIGGLP